MAEDRVAAPDLVGATFRAPKSRTGRLWKVKGRRLGDHLRLQPIGPDLGGFGGAKAIWKTPDELASWERVA